MDGAISESYREGDDFRWRHAFRRTYSMNDCFICVWSFMCFGGVMAVEDERFSASPS